MTTISNEKCSGLLEGEFQAMVHDSVVCAENVEYSSSSLTDTGSALIDVDEQKLIGVLSWMYPYSVDSPEGFTRISPYLDWIAATTGSTF